MKCVRIKEFCESFLNLEAIVEEEDVEEKGLLQLDRAIKTMDHTQRAILINVGLFDDNESSVNDDETEETKQQQEENNKR